MADVKRIVTWTISGGASVALLAAVGCSYKPARQHMNQAGKPAVSAVTFSDNEQVLPVQPVVGVYPIPSAELQAPPQQINIFGEFDGIERRNRISTGQSNLQQHTFVTEGFDADVSIDRTGKWMVFTSTRHNEHPEIYLQRTDGLSVVQLTNDQSDESGPAFSPDGTKIAFASNRSGSWDIYVMDIDGRNVVQVTNGPMQDLHPTWSPDGSMICYSSLGSRSEQWELWTVNLYTLEKRMIGFGLYPAWSPNPSVNRIAFQRARQRGSRWFSLWTLDLVDGEAKRITEVAVSTNAAIVKPTWSPDGTKLAFCTVVEPARTTNGKPTGQQDIWVINADGSNRRRLTDGVASNLMPYWSVDNRVYFISDRSGSEAIWSVRMDDQPSRMATNEAAELTD